MFENKKTVTILKPFGWLCKIGYAVFWSCCFCIPTIATLTLLCKLFLFLNDALVENAVI